MAIIFIISLIGIALMLPLHFLSVEHKKFRKKYGEQRGKKITNILGMTSGWGFFLFLFGLWVAPQTRFSFTSILLFSMNFWILEISLDLGNVLVGAVFIFIGAYLGIKGVLELSLKISETHEANKVIKTGLYSKIRHPQYLGAIFSHIGMSFLFSALLSLIITPLVIFYNYLTAWKEEKELIKEFGDSYEKYRNEVPMLFPRP